MREFDYKKDVDLLVLDSTFASYQDVAFRVLKKNPLTFLFSPFSYLLVSNSYSPESDLKILKTPTLVIHSEMDDIVEFENGKDVYNLLKSSSKKYFWTYKDKSHINFFSIRKIDNQNKFLSLIEKL